MCIRDSCGSVLATLGSSLTTGELILKLMLVIRFFQRVKCCGRKLNIGDSLAVTYDCSEIVENNQLHCDDLNMYKKICHMFVRTKYAHG